MLVRSKVNWDRTLIKAIVLMSKSYLPFVIKDLTMKLEDPELVNIPIAPSHLTKSIISSPLPDNVIGSGEVFRQAM